MKFKELKERSTEDLAQLREITKKDLFSFRMKNATGQLEDTSLIGKARKDLARIELILQQRTVEAAVSTKGGEA
jgi:large subunit ribosomal protein L29